MRYFYRFGRRRSVSRRSELTEEKSSLKFTDQTNALIFLRRVAFGGRNTQVFRQVLHAENVGAVLHQLDDHRVLEHLARMLCTGQIKVHEVGARKREVGGGASGQQAEFDRKPRKEPRPMPQPKRPVERPAAPPAHPKQPINIEAQVASLKAAAISGAPFCEKCERARLERDAAQ